MARPLELGGNVERGHQFAMDDDLGDLDDPTNVDGEPPAPTPAPTPRPDVTKEYDWLAVFNKGIAAGRQDVMDAMRSVLGASPLAEDFEMRVRERLAAASTGRP